MTNNFLIVPCFNEAKRFELRPWEDLLKNNWSLIFVDDGSTDQTYELLSSLSSKYQNCHLIKQKENQGKAEAVRQGMLKALSLGGDIIGFFDADLAVPLTELPRMLERFKQVDLQLLIAARVRMLGYAIQRKASRHYLGRVFATVASIFIGLQVYDTQCGAKLFRKDCVQLLFSERFLSKWIFDVEILWRFKKFFEQNYQGENIEKYVQEIPLLSWKDVDGSKVKPIHFMLALLDLLKIFSNSRK